MAACSKIGGYQCEFVGAISEDFVCGICRHVVREPQLTSCCTETFCNTCITPLLEDKKPCPSCETEGFRTWLNVKYERRILALEVRCTMKDRGCGWTGKLEGLEAHLDVNTGDCEYVDVECPNKCERVEKRNLTTHLTDYCPKREFTCQYCNFKATYEIVSNDHWPQCSFYPVPCPNACGIQAIERGDLEAHLLQCPLEVVECDFSHAGCNTKLPRQDLERHMEESTQKHMVLMSVSLKCSKESQQELQKTTQDSLKDKYQQITELQEQLQKATQEFDRKLKNRDRQITGLHEQLQKKTQENEAKIRDLQQQLQQKAGVLQKTTQDFDRKLKNRDRQITGLHEQLRKKTQENEAKIRDLQQQLQQKAQQVEGLERCMGGVVRPLIEMTDFKQHKDKKDMWYSPPLYTHPGGYKFCIGVEANGQSIGAGTHVTVNYFTMKGELDAQQKWPMKCTITLQLLNQERDQDHITMIKTWQWNRPLGMRQYAGVLTYQFISHKDLEYNAQKQTCYLKNDWLLFRIDRAELK